MDKNQEDEGSYSFPTIAQIKTEPLDFEFISVDESQLEEELISSITVKEEEMEAELEAPTINQKFVFAEQKDTTILTSGHKMATRSSLRLQNKIEIQQGEVKFAKKHTTEKAHTKPVIKRESINYIDFQCHKCFKYFTTKKGLKRHINRIHEKNLEKIRCKFCKKVMKNNNHLLLHEKYIHVNNYNGDKIQCEECGKVAESRISLINHVNAIHIQDYLVVCDICKLVSKNISSLRAHITRNHLIFKGKDKPQCKFCNAKFKYKVQLKNHLRSLNCIKLLPIKCEYCSKMFKNENTLSNHIWQYHTGSQVGKTFTCVDCDKKYMRRSDLAKHIRENHENRKPEKHKCPYCRSYFKARGILNAHIKYLHKRIDIFQCEHCEKNYSRPQHLKRHLKDTHLLKCDGKYYCRQCKVSYPNKLALNVHDCVAT